MKFIIEYDDEGKEPLSYELELTRRNLQALLDKLDDPKSMRTLVDPSGQLSVKAVEDDAHYKTRPPGEVYMPTTGESR